MKFCVIVAIAIVAVCLVAEEVHADEKKEEKVQLLLLLETPVLNARKMHQVAPVMLP